MKENIIAHSYQISKKDRQASNNHNSFLMWFTGLSGSGKSTIAGLGATFLNPQSGIITVDGEDLSKVKLSSYRKHLGVVLQDDFLFEGTIRENIYRRASEGWLQGS